MIKHIRKKENKKKILYILIMLQIMIVMMLSGCSGSNNNTSKKIFVGKEGLVINFFPSNPKSVFEGDDFTISFLLQNKGTYTINNTNPGRYTITFDDFYLKINGSNSKPIILEGRNIINPVGENEYYELFFYAKKIDSLRESVKTKISFNICYPYRTEMSTDVCVDTRINTQDQSVNACQPKTYTNNNGQGAPVAVTKVEHETKIYNEKLARPQYKIYVANLGKGYVVNRKTDTQNVCSNTNINRNSSDLNKLSIRAYLSNAELECVPSELRLQDNEQNNFVRCAVKDKDLEKYLRTNRNYVTILTVVLDYGYVEKIDYDIEIKRKDEIIPQEKACGYYEVYRNGECITKCEFCSKNPNDPLCTKSANVPSTFRWDEGFSCSCTLNKCRELAPRGDCIFGYCPGTTYCCRTNECQGWNDGVTCGDNYVCINQKCSSKTQCEYTYGEYAPYAPENNNVYKCQNIQNCIKESIITGMCPGGTDNVCCVATK